MYENALIPLVNLYCFCTEFTYCTKELMRVDCVLYMYAIQNTIYTENENKIYRLFLILGQRNQQLTGGVECRKRL